MFEKNIHIDPKFKSDLLAHVLASSEHLPWWTTLTFHLTVPALSLALLLFVAFQTNLPQTITAQVDSGVLTWQLDHAPAVSHADQQILAEEQDLLNL